MKLVSSPASGDRGEITLLAILETVVAITVSICVATVFDTLFHIAVGACLAPLLLLRSKQSTHLASSWFSGFAARLKPVSQITEEQGRSFINLSMLIIVSVGFRIASTIRHPLAGLKSLPNNWQGVTLCTDMFAPPEFVPTSGSVSSWIGKLSRDESESRWTWWVYMAALFWGIILILHLVRAWADLLWITIASWLIELWILWSVSLATVGLLCFVIAYLYRFSLKSTALVWTPLIYIVRSTFDESLSVQARVTEIVTSSLWRIIRLVSWFTLAAMTAKVLLLPQIIDWWNAQPWSPILDVYVMPTVIHPWHLAATLNAIIALVGYHVFIDRATLYLQEGAWSEIAVDRGLRIFAFVRGVISIYTILVSLFLTIKAAESMAWPSWSRDVFPW